MRKLRRSSLVRKTYFRSCETGLQAQFHMPRESFGPSNKLALAGASRYCVGVSP